ncbi:hypothetical protein KBD09_00845 [Candidatus Woesebacteria bacterium]|nr:hypothetical protein [Candidatus Woesebacteria bacterium]
MHKNKILIVEPNRHLITPYNKFPAYWSIQRSDTIETALKDLRVHNPELIFLSTSFSLTKSIRLLDAIKNFSYSKLIPIIFVVDFSHRISHFPGTSWGGKAGIIHSLSSKDEINSTISRVLNS